MRLGAPQVTIAYRRTREQMPAYAFEVADAEAEGVTFEWLAAPAALQGDRRVQRVVFDRLRLGEGRALEIVAGAQFTLWADSVVAAIGQQPRTELSTWFGGLDLAHGVLAADVETGRTSAPYIYAGGDATNGGASVVQAVADGKRAARAIEEALCAT